MSTYHRFGYIPQYLNRQRCVPLEGTPWLKLGAPSWLVTLGPLLVLAAVVVLTRTAIVFLFLGVLALIWGLLGLAATIYPRTFQVCPKCVSMMSRGATRCPQCRFEG